MVLMSTMMDIPPEMKTADDQIIASPARRAIRLHALTRTAADMFLEHGYEALSIEALIERTGGSRRNVYAHFGGKEQLFIDAMAQRCHELGEPLRTLKIADIEGDVERPLKMFGRELLDIVLKPDAVALHRLMVAEGKRFPELAVKMWHAGYHVASELLEAWIRQQQSLGNLRSTRDAGRAATQFVAMVTTDLQLRALVGLKFSSRDIRAMLDEATAIFLHGLA
jgi:AcrR family transcriptional regulator